MKTKLFNIALCLLVGSIVWGTKAVTSDKVIVDILMLSIIGFWLSVKTTYTR